MEDAQLPLRLVCSDELGLLKVVQTPDGARLDAAGVVASWGQPDKVQAVSCLRLGSRGGLRDADTAVLATARATGAIDILNPCSAEVVGSIPAAAAPTNGSSSNSSAAEAAVVRGLHWVWGGPAGEGVPSMPALLSLTQGGTARLHAASDGTWEQLRSWQVPGEVCCTAYDPGSCTLAVGCQGSELRLFDASTGQLTFSAKGGKPNKVGLVDRPWNTALCFLPSSASPASASAAAAGAANTAAAEGSSGSVVLAGTAYHKLRLYDVRAGKRPQADLSFGETRVTALAPEAGGLRCWVGNGLGQLEVLDLRTLKMAGAIKGIAGSVRSLAVHPSRPIIASVGLDRFLRLHDIRTRQLLGKVYLKTQLTGVEFCPVSADMLRQQPQPQEEGGELEEGAQEGHRERKKERKGKKEKRGKEDRSSGRSSEKKAKRVQQEA